MVVVRLQGGLGNQMFQYAFGISLAAGQSHNVKIDTGLLEDAQSNMRAVQRAFALEPFGLKNGALSKIDQLRFAPRRNATLLARVLTRVLQFIFPFELRLQKGNEYAEQYKKKSNLPICVVGRWQSPKFFESFDLLVKDIFSPDKLSPSESVRNLFDQFTDDILVGVHVRRGDYVTHPLYSKMLGALALDYYESSFALLQRRYPDQNLRFLIVSDDISWCKSKFKDLDRVCFVEGSDALSDLWLLSKTNIAVISNSTFGWWGGFLGDDKRLVLAPSKWAKDLEYIPDEILPSHWVEVQTSFEK